MMLRYMGWGESEIYSIIEVQAVVRRSDDGGVDILECVISKDDPDYLVGSVRSLTTQQQDKVYDALERAFDEACQHALPFVSGLAS